VKYSLLHVLTALGVQVVMSLLAQGSAAVNVKMRRPTTRHGRRKSNDRGHRLRRQATRATSLHFRRK